MPSAAGRTLYGVIGISVVCAIIVAAFAAYSGAFTSTYDVTVRTPRIGLGLVPGSDVAYRGVAIGRVKEIEPDPDGGAVLQVAIYSDQASAIPSDVRAYIDSSTLFGPKSVQLRAPRSGSEARLSEGDVVEAMAVSPELNSLYDQIYTLVSSVDVAKLNAGLSSIATTLDGRGKQIGGFASDVLDYVEVVNDNLPAIENDIRLGRRVVGDYDAATDDLLAVTSNATRLSQTLVHVRPTLNTFLLSLARSADNADLLVREIDEPLIGALTTLRPGLSVLSRFSPMMGCTIKGFNELRELADAVIKPYAAIQTTAEVLPGQRPYRPEDSLPKIVTGVGPHCYGLPVLEGHERPSPHYLFDDGTIPTWTSGEGDSLQVGLDSLFGTNLQALLSARTQGERP